MKIKIVKTSNQTLVKVESGLTQEILTRVPESSRQLRDENKKVVFTVQYSKDPAVKDYGMSVPGKTFFVDFTGRTEKDVKYFIANVLPNATKVEKQILDAYKALEEAAAKIEVEGE